jgi:hypothetical protein
LRVVEETFRSGDEGGDGRLVSATKLICVSSFGGGCGFA